MLMISCYTYYLNNRFTLKEIYVGTDSELYVLNKSDNYVPSLYKMSLIDYVDSVKNNPFPLGKFSPLRQYEDDDAKSFVNFLFSKIKDTDLSNELVEKKLSEVIESFGNPYVSNR